MNVETIEISKLITDPSNARKHDGKNIEAIKGSLAKFGQQKPIVVGDNNVVVAGNGTLEAAQALNWDTINIVRTGLKGVEALAYSIADNRTQDLSEFDIDELKLQLDALNNDNFDLNMIGYDANDMALFELPEKAYGKEFDENVIDEVQFNECPECGHKWPK